MGGYDWYRTNVPWVLSHKIIDPSGRYAILVGKVKSLDVILVGLYAPNQNHSMFWKSITDLVTAYKSFEMMVLGDFNAVIDSSWDRSHDTIAGNLPKTFQ